MSSSAVDQVHSDLSYEFSSVMKQLPAGVRDRINIQNIEAVEPIQAVIEASAAVDLTIAGTSRAWGIERQTLGRYTDQLAIQCQSSLLITRRYSKSYFSPLLNAGTAVNGWLE